MLTPRLTVDFWDPRDKGRVHLVQHYLDIRVEVQGYNSLYYIYKYIIGIYRSGLWFRFVLFSEVFLI